MTILGYAGLILCIVGAALGAAAIASYIVHHRALARKLAWVYPDLYFIPAIAVTVWLAWLYWSDPPHWPLQFGTVFAGRLFTLGLLAFTLTLSVTSILAPFWRSLRTELLAANLFMTGLLIGLGLATMSWSDTGQHASAMQFAWIFWPLVGQYGLLRRISRVDAAGGGQPAGPREV